MRRRPAPESPTTPNTHVFSSDAWGTNDTSYAPAPTETHDLSQYAAALVPEGVSRTTRGTRYESYAYTHIEQSPQHVTNSQGDPFQSAVLDTRTQQQPVQHAPHVSDMPQPVRHTRLGQAPQQSVGAQPAPAPQTPQAYAAPAPAPVAQPAPQTPQAYAAPAPAPVAQQAPQTPQAYAAPAPAPVAQPAPAHHTHVSVHGIAAPHIPAPSPAPVVETVQARIETVIPPTPAQALPQGQVQPDQTPVQETKTAIESEEEVPLSDFEQEFNELKTDEATLSTGTQEIDLTEFDPPSTVLSSFAPPQLFSNGVVPPGPVYRSNDDFFEYSHNDVSAEDQLYRDDRVHRETIQIDLDFIKRHAKRLVANKLVLIVLAIAIAGAAYLIVKPVVSGNESPAPAESNMGGGKTVITDPAGQPVVTNNQAPVDETPVDSNVAPSDPNAAPADPNAGPTIYLDQNGQVIYSNEINQNFNE